MLLARQTCRAGIFCRGNNEDFTKASIDAGCAQPSRLVIKPVGFSERMKFRLMLHLAVLKTSRRAVVIACARFASLRQTSTLEVGISKEPHH
jgi:hypothetical protein